MHLKHRHTPPASAPAPAPTPAPTPALAPPTLILLALALLSASLTTLPVPAQNKHVTAGTVVESDSAYAGAKTGATTTAALEVSGAATTYHGAGITLSNTFPNSTGNAGSGHGAYAHDGATLSLTGGAITTSGRGGYGILLTATSSGTLTGMDITTTGANTYGARIATSSSLTLNATTIAGANMTAAVLVDDGMVDARDFLMQSTGVGLQTTGSNSTALLTGGTLNAASWGLAAYVSSTITGARLQITTSGNTPAVISKWGGHIELTDTTITTPTGDGVQNISGGGHLKLTGVTINCAVTGVRLTDGIGTADLENLTITTTAASGYGIQADEGSAINAKNLDITTGGNQSRGVYSALGSAIYLSGSIQITTRGYDAHGLLARYTNNAKYSDDTRIIAAAGSVINITIKGGNALLPSSGVQASTATGDLHRSYIKLDGATHVTLAESARGYGFYSTGSNTGIQAAAGSITTHNTNGHGIYSASRGSVEAAGFVITSTGKTAHGVYAASSGSVTLRDSAISATGSSSSGLYASGGVIDGHNLDITSADGATVRLQNNATIRLADATVRNTGAGPGVQLGSTGAYRTIFTMTDGAIISDTQALLIDTGAANGAITINLDQVTIINSNNNSHDDGHDNGNGNSHGHLLANLSRAGEITLDLTRADTARAGGIMVGATNSGTTRVTINGGSGITGDVTNAGNGALTLALNNSGALTGNVTNAGNSALTLTLNNSGALTGNVTNTGNGALTLALNSGALTGNVTNTGNGALTLALNNSGALTGDVTNAGSGALTLALNNSGALTGNVTNAGNGALTLALNNSTLTGDLAANADAALTVTLDRATLTGATAITGTVTGATTAIGATTGATTATSAAIGTLTGAIAATAATTDTLTGATTLTATAAATATDAATLSMDIRAASVWNLTATSTLTRLALAPGARVNFPDPAQHAGAHATLTTATLTGAGEFALHTDIAAARGDRIEITGTATGAHRLRITNTGAGTPAALLPVVITAGGDATFTGTATAGLYDYTVQNGAHIAATAPDSGLTPADAANWYLARFGLSATADAIINTAAMLGRDWHYTLDALHLRMGDLRADWLRGWDAPAGHAAAGSPSQPYPTPAAPSTSPSNLNYVSNGSAIGNVWARARAYRLNADAALNNRPFTQYAYGLTAGADRAFRLGTAASTATGAGSTLLAGAFIDMGRIDRDFSGDSATGHTDNLSAGLYGTWLHDTGWHADLVLKADRYKHRFDTQTADARPVTAAYNSTAQGISLELGRRFTRAGDAGGWWLEPTAQAALAWLHGATYRTAPGNQTLDVRLATARAAQYRAQLRFGRQLRDSRWLPYGKFGVVKTDTAGGEIRVDGEPPFAPDCDGWRGEFGLGTSYLLTARTQLYLDYDYSKSAHYERPWSLHLGYRMLW